MPRPKNNYFNASQWLLGGFSMIPNVILKYPELSPSAKLLWGRLFQYMGSSDRCYPRQDTLAEEIGISQSQVKRLIRELVKKGFLGVKRRSMNLNNEYHFEKHEVFRMAEKRPKKQEGS